MAQPASKSIEELLAADDDLKFFDDVNGERCDQLLTIVTKCDQLLPITEFFLYRGNEEVDNAYDYHLHLNNYLPTYNVSETDQSDEQTPMLSRLVCDWDLSESVQMNYYKLLLYLTFLICIEVK